MARFQQVGVKASTLRLSSWSSSETILSVAMNCFEGAGRTEMSCMTRCSEQILVSEVTKTTHPAIRTKMKNVYGSRHKHRKALAILVMSKFSFAENFVIENLRRDGQLSNGEIIYQFRSMRGNFGFADIINFCDL